MATLDTHKFVCTMKNAGMPPKQAEAMVSELKEVEVEALATGDDIAGVKHEITDLKQDITDLRTDVAERETRLTMRIAGLLGLLFVAQGFLLRAFQLFGK